MNELNLRRPRAFCRGIRVGGFTLIELMIVVAVIAILVAIAYPAYDNYVRKTYRADAQADLMEAASYMERYYTENNTYVGAALPYSQTPHGGNARYNITLVTAAGPPSTFTITSTAQALGGQSSDACGNMTINNAGSKTHTGSLANCW
jgi:type IV pilus assembly protein PilE